MVKSSESSAGAAETSKRKVSQSETKPASPKRSKTSRAKKAKSDDTSQLQERVVQLEERIKYLVEVVEATREKVADLEALVPRPVKIIP